MVYSTEELVQVLQEKIPLPALVKGNYYKAYLVYNVETVILKGNEIASGAGVSPPGTRANQRTGAEPDPVFPMPKGSW